MHQSVCCQTAGQTASLLFGSGRAWPCWVAYVGRRSPAPNAPAHSQPLSHSPPLKHLLLCSRIPQRGILPFKGWKYDTCGASG
jgi:hypothetical protein